MFELLYWRKSYRKFHGKPVPISFESWAFYLIISSIRLNMSSLIVCRLLASNYQANNHYNRAGTKCPIFLVMNTCQHDFICQQDANINVANSYRHPYLWLKNKRWYAIYICMFILHTYLFMTGMKNVVHGLKDRLTT